MDNNSIFNNWYKENEEKMIQSHSDVEAVAFAAFEAGAKAMESFMEKKFDNSTNKKNFIKKHFWDLL